ncbi:hypothetical protein JCM10212_002751 [Sporobolomyces blumeae]
MSPTIVSPRPVRPVSTPYRSPTRRISRAHSDPGLVLSLEMGCEVEAFPLEEDALKLSRPSMPRALSLSSSSHARSVPNCDPSAFHPTSLDSTLFPFSIPPTILDEVESRPCPSSSESFDSPRSPALVVPHTPTLRSQGHHHLVPPSPTSPTSSISSFLSGGSSASGWSWTSSSGSTSTTTGSSMPITPTLCSPLSPCFYLPPATPHEDPLIEGLDERFQGGGGGGEASRGRSRGLGLELGLGRRPAKDDDPILDEFFSILSRSPTSFASPVLPRPTLSTPTTSFTIPRASFPSSRSNDVDPDYDPYLASRPNGLGLGFLPSSLVVEGSPSSDPAWRSGPAPYSPFEPESAFEEPHPFDRMDVDRDEAFFLDDVVEPRLHADGGGQLVDRYGPWSSTLTRPADAQFTFDDAWNSSMTRFSRPPSRTETRNPFSKFLSSSLSTTFFDVGAGGPSNELASPLMTSKISQSCPTASSSLLGFREARSPAQYAASSTYDDEPTYDLETSSSLAFAASSTSPSHQSSCLDATSAPFTPCRSLPTPTHLLSSIRSSTPSTRHRLADSPASISTFTEASSSPSSSLASRTPSPRTTTQSPKTRPLPVFRLPANPHPSSPPRRSVQLPTVHRFGPSPSFRAASHSSPSLPSSSSSTSVSPSARAKRERPPSPLPLAPDPTSSPPRLVRPPPPSCSSSNQPATTRFVESHELDDASPAPDSSRLRECLERRWSVEQFHRDLHLHRHRTDPGASIMSQ